MSSGATAPVTGGGDGDVQWMGHTEWVQFCVEGGGWGCPGERGDSRSSCEPRAPATVDDVGDEVPVFPGRRGYVK